MGQALEWKAWSGRMVGAVGAGLRLRLGRGLPGRWLEVELGGPFRFCLDAADECLVVEGTLGLRAHDFAMVAKLGEAAIDHAGEAALVAADLGEGGASKVRSWRKA